MITAFLKVQQGGRRRRGYRKKWSESCIVAGFQDGGRGATSQRCGLQKLEGQETDSSLEPPERNAALLKPSYRPAGLVSDFLPTDGETINVRRFKAPSSWSFAKATGENEYRLFLVIIW